MSSKYAILPNAVLLACAFVLFHRSFLSGHPTWIGSLVTLSPLLTLAYSIIGRMPKYLRYAAALLNTILFLTCGYAFAGTVHMLVKAKAAHWPFFLMIGLLWLFAFTMVFGKLPGLSTLGAILTNLAMAALGALGLYARTTGWAPWMTAALFGALIAVAGINVCLFANFFSFRKREP